MKEIVQDTFQGFTVHVLEFGSRMSMFGEGSGKQRLEEG